MQKNNTIWASLVVSLLGIWLLAAPATFGFKSQALVWSDWVAGILFLFLGVWNRKQDSYVFPWIIGMIGIWLQFAPLVFWAPDPASYLNDTAVGALAIALSLLIPKMPHAIDDEPSIPPGWSYNPSSPAQRAPIALLIFICWMVSRYLAAFELGYIHEAWDPFFGNGTEKVLTSNISRDFPVPDAGLGAFAYTLEFLSTCQGGKARWRTDPWLVLIFGILVIPVGFTSVCLIILQPLDVGTWCTLCLITAICMLVAIPFALDEVAAALQYLRKSKGKPFFAILFKGGECDGAMKDENETQLDEPFSKIFKAALKGISFPWNLLLSAFLGILLMVVPWPFHEKGLMFDLDPIIGALVVVFSVISLSEIARKLRRMNLFLAFVLLVGTIVFWGELPALLIGIHLAVAMLIALLFLGSSTFGKRGI